MSNVDNKKNILIFLTGGFPFGKGETFIENEIEELSSRFEEIIIIAHDVNSVDYRKVPKNITIKRINYELPFLRKLLFFPVFFR